MDANTWGFCSPGLTVLDAVGSQGNSGQCLLLLLGWLDERGGFWSDEDKLKSFVHSCAGAPVFRNRCSTDGKMEDFRIFYKTE